MSSIFISIITIVCILVLLPYLYYLPVRTFSFLLKFAFPSEDNLLILVNRKQLSAQ